MIGVPGAGSVRWSPATSGPATSGDGVPVRDGRFDATVELRQQKYRFGRWPLPIGEHDVRLVGHDRIGTRSTERAPPGLERRVRASCR